ncbi:MAG: hypothetical protein BroJett024_19020 [Alphaproteobacteria bacterium]|nr:MAG: hypothetical protein BroJett024_19020 [Alphaproteobacteria bacterium]
MPLVLEVEHLLGVAFAARSPASTLPDWPPQADRIFSGLVAAWGARGARDDERRALEWLETQPAPEVSASDGFARTAATAFVPPNDPQTGRVGNRSVMPAFRRKQPRRFPAFRPHDPVVRLVWRDVEADEDTLAALNALAADTPYVGHSASLARCRFRSDGTPEETTPASRRIYGGRLAELEHAYRNGRRPAPGASVPRKPVAEPAPPRSGFASRWLVLEDVGGTMPDLRGAALVAKVLRNTLMSGYKRIGRQTAIPVAVSGHAPDGAPAVDSHLAIAPLAFLAMPYADGRVLGFALIPPGEGELLDDAAFQQAVKAVAPWNPEEGRRELQLSGDGVKLTLAISGEAGRQSLDPGPYVATARTWATCTPIVLDRYLKETGNEARDCEVRELVARACRHIGLPEPARIAAHADATEEPAIVAGKHSAIVGAPSAYPSRRSPRWTAWRLPKNLANRQLTHAVVHFEQPVRGPVILGAGRFVGLGLCRALDSEER